MKIVPKQKFKDNIKLYPKISKKQEGGNLTQEDKDRLWELKNTFGDYSSKDEYFNYWNFIPIDSEISDYFNSYLKSPGINRILNNQNTWWESRHPYRKYYSNSDKGTKLWLDKAAETSPKIYTADMYTDQSFVNNNHKFKQRTGLIGRRESAQFPFDFVLGHEYAHGKAPFSVIGTASFHPDSAQREALNQNQGAEKNKHDEKPLEKHADNWGLKYLLYKTGIYDAREDKDITIDQVEQLRKLYPELRPFKQMDNKQIQFQLNNVATNKQKKSNKFNV